MKLLLTYVLTTVGRKPFRLALILLILGLSGAAMLASVSLSDTMIQTATRQWRSEYGYADIVIKPNPASASRYLDPFKLERYSDAVAYAVPKLSAEARMGEQTLRVHGFPLETLQRMTELPVLEQLNLFPFAGNKILVSAKFAADNGARPGDTLTLNLRGNRHVFVVVGLCPSVGPFVSEREVYSAVIPLEKMQACLGQLGKADALYVGLKDRAAVSPMILRLSTLYRGLSVDETYSVDHIRLQTNRSAMPFVFMSLLLCLMAVYVVYVIFQNIVLERMPQMGVFRAIGASRGTTNAVLLVECGAYGMLGGALSLGAGLLILRGLGGHLQTAEQAGAVVLSVAPWHVAGTVVLCMAISLVGGALSLRRWRVLSIVALLRRAAEEAPANRVRAPLASLVLFLLALAALALWRSTTGFALYVLLVLAVLVSFLMASAFLCRQFAVAVKRAASRIRGVLRIASLSVQNQRGFLIAATITAVITATNLIIGTITYSNDEGSRRYFERFLYDIEVTAGDLTRGRVALIEQLPGIRSVCANDYSGSTEVQGQSLSLYRVHGVDPLKAGDFMDYAFESAREDPLGALESGKNILLTQTLRNLYGVAENDVIVLKIFGYDGVYREVPYTVIGFYEDEMTKLGRYALISHRNFAEDYRARTYASLYVIADDVEKALASIRDAYYDKQAQATTVRELREAQQEESRLILSAMRWISNLSAVTGTLGMLFIMILSFQSRTNELAIYEAIGMERTGMGRMLLTEMLLAGIGGLLAGLGVGLAISRIALPRLIYALQIAMSIHFHPALLGQACGFGMGICLASGILGAVRFGKVSPMGGLRHE